MSRVSLEDVRRALAGRGATSVGPEVAHRAAVALILRDAAAGLELLFIRRAEHPDDPWSGQMAFPGGRTEPGDAELRTTAVRETAEEIGFDLDRWGEFLGPLDEVRAMARMRPMNLAIAPFVFRLSAEPPALDLGAEVTSVHWLALDDLLGPEHRGLFEYAHQGTALQFPCLRVDEVVIWGLTYRMFASFQQVLEGASGPARAPGLAR